MNATRSASARVKNNCCPKPIENRDVRAAALKPGETNVPEHGPLACYAESRDGINWSKPVLRLYDYKGSRDNNIVWTGEAPLNLAHLIVQNAAAHAAVRYTSS